MYELTSLLLQLKLSTFCFAHSSFSLFHFILTSFPLLNLKLLVFIRGLWAEVVVQRVLWCLQASWEQALTGIGRHTTQPHWGPVCALGTLLSKVAILKHAEKYFYLHEKHHRNEELNLITAVVYFK